MKMKDRMILLFTILMLCALTLPVSASEENQEEGSVFIQEDFGGSADSVGQISEDVDSGESLSDDLLDAALILEDEEICSEETDAEPLPEEDGSWPSAGIEADTERNAEASTESDLETGDTLDGIITVDQVEEIGIEDEIAPISGEIIDSGTFGGVGATSKYGSSGHDGHNLTWIFDANGVLTIKGTGEMGDFWSTQEFQIRPWEAYIPEITKVVIEDGVTTVGKGAFSYHEALTSVTIPSSVYYIVCFAFNSCTSLSAIELPDGVALGHYVFEGCTNLKKITIPGGVQNFGTGDFDGTPWLAAQGDFCIVNHVLLAYQGTASDIVIPDEVTKINEGAFAYSEYVKSVTIPNGRTSFTPEAFDACKSVTDINISDANPNYASVDGVVFNKEKTSLLRFPAGREGEYSIPEGILTIDQYAFRYSRLTSITIPGSVTTAGMYAFGFSALEHVAIPGSLQTISWGMFSGCRSLSNVEIGYGVSKLDDYAFANCTSLCTLTLPASVSDIGCYSFEGCSGLTSIFVENNSCNIFDRESTFVSPNRVVIYGTRGSTAEEYAGRYGYTFGLPSVADPVLVSVSAVPEGAKISWNAVDGAVCYRILYKFGSGNWERLADTTDTEYTWVDGEDGTKYDFTVQCVTRDGITALSGYDATGKSLVYIAPPEKSETEIPDIENPNNWDGQDNGGGMDITDTPDTPETPETTDTTNVTDATDAIDDQDGMYFFKTPVSLCKITLSKSKYTYNGKKCKPSVTIKDGKKKLILNTHYTLSYKNNLNAGTASVVITGKGQYNGKVVKKFKIKKKTQKLKASVSSKSVKINRTLKIKVKKSIGKVTYKSLNKKIAKVTSKGKVKGISTGKVKIIVKAAGDRNHKAASKTFLIRIRK